MSEQFRRMWAWPIGLGVLTASGLVSGLVSDHLGDVWAWVGLGVPVVVMCYYGFKKGEAA